MIEFLNKWDTTKECFDELFKRLLAEFKEGVRKVNNIIYLDNKFVKGEIEFQPLGDEMALYRLDTTASEVISMKKNVTSKPEYYTILFSLKEEPDFHRFYTNVSNDDIIEIGLLAKRAVVYSSSDVANLFKVSPNTRTKFLFLIISAKELMKDVSSFPSENNWVDISNGASIKGYTTMDAKMIDEANAIFDFNYPAYIRTIYFKGIVYQLLALLMYEIKEENEKLIEDTGLVESARMVQIKNLLIDDFSKPYPSLEETAKVAHMSTTKFKKLFKKLFKLPYYQYYQHYRLLQAKKLLSIGTSVKDTSYEVGFSNPAHFTAAFKKKFNKLPSEIV